MYKKNLLLILFLLVFPFYTGYPQASSGEKDWRLVWQDEFNDERLDTSRWNVLLREQSKHNELQYYVPDEVYVENGHLRIRSRVRNYGSQQYTSGRVNTSGKFRWSTGVSR